MPLQYIDWQAVYSYYISSEKINYPDCAKKFSISVDSVKKKGSQEHWTAKKLQVLQAATKLIENKSIELIAKRNEEHIKQARLLQGAALEAIAEKGLRPESFDVARKAIETGQKLERTALGMDQRNPNVEFSDNKGQHIRISWGDDQPIADYVQTGNNLELVKTYDTY